MAQESALAGQRRSNRVRFEQSWDDLSSTLRKRTVQRRLAITESERSDSEWLYKTSESSGSELSAKENGQTETCRKATALTNGGLASVTSSAVSFPRPGETDSSAKKRVFSPPKASVPAEFRRQRRVPDNVPVDNCLQIDIPPPPLPPPPPPPNHFDKDPKPLLMTVNPGLVTTFALNANVRQQAIKAAEHATRGEQSINQHTAPVEQSASNVKPPQPSKSTESNDQRPADQSPADSFSLNFTNHPGSRVQNNDGVFTQLLSEDESIYDLPNPLSETKEAVKVCQMAATLLHQQQPALANHLTGSLLRIRRRNPATDESADYAEPSNRSCYREVPIYESIADRSIGSRSCLLSQSFTSAGSSNYAKPFEHFDKRTPTRGPFATRLHYDYTNLDTSGSYFGYRSMLPLRSSTAMERQQHSISGLPNVSKAKRDDFYDQGMEPSDEGYPYTDSVVPAGFARSRAAYFESMVHIKPDPKAHKTSSRNVSSSINPAKTLEPQLAARSLSSLPPVTKFTSPYLPSSMSESLAHSTPLASGSCSPQDSPCAEKKVPLCFPSGTGTWRADNYECFMEFANQSIALPTPMSSLSLQFRDDMSEDELSNDKAARHRNRRVSFTETIHTLEFETQLEPIDQLDECEQSAVESTVDEEAATEMNNSNSSDRTATHEEEHLIWASTDTKQADEQLWLVVDNKERCKKKARSVGLNLARFLRNALGSVIRCNEVAVISDGDSLLSDELLSHSDLKMFSSEAVNRSVKPALNMKKSNESKSPSDSGTEMTMESEYDPSGPASTLTDIDITLKILEEKARRCDEQMAKKIETPATTTAPAKGRLKSILIRKESSESSSSEDTGSSTTSNSSESSSSESSSSSSTSSSSSESDSSSSSNDSTECSDMSESEADTSEVLSETKKNQSNSSLNTDTGISWTESSDSETSETSESSSDGTSSSGVGLGSSSGPRESSAGTPAASTVDESRVDDSDCSILLNDGKHSLLQFAVYHFRQSPEKSCKFEILRSENGSLLMSQQTDSGKTKKSKGKKSREKELTSKEQVDMIKYSKTAIEASLLRIESAELNKFAVECFVAIMRYMGDYALVKGQTEVDCVYFVLMTCHKHESLRDEVYCQLMKQTTNNKSSSPESCQRGWRLFTIVAAYFNCSDILSPYLFKYLETAAFDKRRGFQGTALVCLQNLRKTLRYGGRKNVPSFDEITAITAGRNSKRQMYRLPGGTERVINTKSTSVVQDIIEEIGTAINVRSGYEMEEYSLYCVVESEPYTIPLEREEYILDVTTELQKNQKEYYLVFCRSVWYYPMRLDNILYIDIIFNQVAPDYMEGLLLVMPGEQITQEYVYDIAKIAALLHRAADSDHMPTMKETKYLLPKPVLTVRDIKPPQWVNLVQNSWREIEFYKPFQAKAEVLEILQSWPLFGSTFFVVRRLSDPPELSEHILALNKKGMYFLDAVTHETLLHYSYSEVISTRKVKAEDGLYLDVKVGNAAQQRTSRIQTSQAHEISRLIRQYMTTQQRVQSVRDHEANLASR